MQNFKIYVRIKNMKKYVLLILISLIFMVGCNKEIESKNEHNKISSAEAYEMMTTRENIIVVDVRNEEEYNEGHIDGAINLPLMKIEEKFKSLVTKNKDDVILVYCKSGVRAGIASETLVKMGYKNVYNFGGIDTWEYGLVTLVE